MKMNIDVDKLHVYTILYFSGETENKVECVSN